jgi:hypothetical protein
VFLKDKKLSIKAKGFLAVVMGLPSDWEFTINGVCSIIKEGKTAIYNVIDELKVHGYCNVVTCRDEKGRITGNDYTFYEEPQLEIQVVDCPRMENLDMDNQPQLSTNSINNLFDKEEEIDLSISKKEQKDEFFEQCWLNYRRKGSKKKSLEQWKKLSNEEKEQTKKHILAYIESVSDVKYQKDFERYLRDKCFLNVVYKDGKTIFDSEMPNESQKEDKLVVNGVIYR